MTSVAKGIRHLLSINAAFFKAALLFVLLYFIAACTQQQQYQQSALNGNTMGTTWSAKIVLPAGATLDSEGLQKKLDQALIDFNQIVSTYIADSEISLFNQSQSTASVKVNAELASLVKVSQQVYEQSEGLFDITVAPLVTLWGFGKHSLDEDRIPSEQDIIAANAQIGSGKMLVDTDASILQKQQANLQINLSAIAKGRGVDLLAEILDAENLQNYMVEIGGEIRAQGINSKGKVWQIAIEEPLANQRSIQRVVGLYNTAIATSGDYRNFFEINGQRYSHSINPNTGWPVKHQLVSVTVLHPQAMLADAWATTLLVAGPEKAMQLANQHGLAVLLIEKTEAGFKEQANKLFTDYTSQMVAAKPKSEL